MATDIKKNHTISRRALAVLVMALLACACALFASCASSSTSSAQSSSSASFSAVSDSSASSSSASASSSAASLETSFEIKGMTWDPATLANAQAINSDVYAWLYVPDTSVNHSILQSPPENEDLYLSTDIYGNGSGLGELYSQATYNTNDFNDPVTFIYGHTFDPGSGLEEAMFGSLHNYEDKAFFDSHPYFYVFMPDKVLKYEVVSAYEYENRHVLDSFDFSRPTVQQEYFDYVLNPTSASDVKNVREGVKKLVAGQDKILQLATCTRPADDAFRYLVTGKLVGNMPLK